MRNGSATHARKKPIPDPIQEIGLDHIRLDPEVQPRKGEDPDVMREYTAAWLEGADFPPVAVYWDRDEDVYYLADGFHRVRSAVAARMVAIRAHVYLGGRRDAILHSAGANAEHGLRRSHQDKQRAVLRLLSDPEWSLWSDSEIARVCKVSPSMVRQYRGSDPGLKGHGIDVRINAAGRLATGPERPEVAGRRPAPSMHQVPLTKDEIDRLFASKLAKHLRRISPLTRTDVAYPLGRLQIVTSRRIYQTILARESDYLYRVLGKLVVARALVGPALGITLVGHFAPALGPLIEALGRIDVRCETPEQVLRRKGED